MRRNHRPPIIASRVRQIAGLGFAFIPHRFLRDGFVASLDQHELGLYVVLVLAGDRHGMSFYHYDSLCSLLQMDPDTYLRARNSLISKDLIAFDGSRYQVLSLPERPVFSARPPLSAVSDFEDNDPATIRRIIRKSLGE